MSHKDKKPNGIDCLNFFENRSSHYLCAILFRPFFVSEDSKWNTVEESQRWGYTGIWSISGPATITATLHALFPCDFLRIMV